MSSLERIGIGTAQFGMNYGVSNSLGKTSESDISSILNDAWRNGVQYIDTASLYGDAEEKLGRLLAVGNDFRIVTKLTGLETDNAGKNIEKLVEFGVESSLRKLKQTSLYALLVHSADDLLAGNGELLWNTLQQLKGQGKMRKVGASVYNPNELEQLMERFPLEIVQLPLNLFDQRFIRSGALKELKERNVEIHTRSCFLQGLLLMEPKSIPTYFESVRDKLSDIRCHCATLKCSPLDFALSFALSVEQVDCVIVGVNTYSHFLEIRRSIERNIYINASDAKSFVVNDLKIIEPYRWETLC